MLLIMNSEGRRWRKVILIVLLLLTIIVLPRILFPPEIKVSVGNIPLFSLDGYERLLIFAPHCDDETLGTGGMILAAQRAGLDVRVVISTNGDGYLFATMQDFQKLYPQPQDFIRMGKLRQQESLAALAVLGLSPENVYFLSYPDRGSPFLWNENWSTQHPFRSPYSQDTTSPYPLTYDRQAVYSGEDFLADITTILEDYRPDLIVYPHPDDVHPDHWGLNVFTRLAITQVEHANPTYIPTELTYLVHRSDFPEIRGLKPAADLVPPAMLYAISHEWLRWDLTPSDVTLKAQAVQEYQSQLPLLRGLMESFVRANELFAPAVSRDLQMVAVGNPSDPSTWFDASGQAIQSVQLDPVADFITRDAVPAGDLVAFYAALDARRDLHVCSQAREDAAPELIYAIRLKALAETGIIDYATRTGEASSGWQTAQRSGKYICATINLSSLGNPWAIYVGANVEGGGSVMDEIAWQMIYVRAP